MSGDPMIVDAAELGPGELKRHLYEDKVRALKKESTEITEGRLVYDVVFVYGLGWNRALGVSCGVDRDLQCRTTNSHSLAGTHPEYVEALATLEEAKEEKVLQAKIFLEFQRKNIEAMFDFEVKAAEAEFKVCG
jgi:Sds3-like protein